MALCNVVESAADRLSEYRARGPSAVPGIVAQPAAYRAKWIGYRVRPVRAIEDSSTKDSRSTHAGQHVVQRPTANRAWTNPRHRTQPKEWLVNSSVVPEQLQNPVVVPDGHTALDQNVAAALGQY